MLSLCITFRQYNVYDSLVLAKINYNVGFIFEINTDIIISVKINTWSRYGILLVYVLIFRICKVFITELGMPILNFNIYDPNKKEIEGFTRTELQVQANLMYMMNAIIYALTLQLSIIQIDIAVISGIFSEMASIPTIHILLKDKEFVDEKKQEVFGEVELEQELYHTL